MSRTRIIFHRDGGRTELRDGEHVPRGTKGPHIISDTMQQLQHPATGLYTDSKSSFRRMTRAAGYVEVGNDQKIEARTMPDVPNRAQDIKAAIEQLRSRS